jgi:hypothetical protein
MVMLGRLRLAYPGASAWLLLAVCAGGGTLLMLTPYVIYHGQMELAVLRAFLALPMAGAAVLTFYLIQPGMHDCPFDTARWVRQAACGTAASLPAAAVLAM